MCFSYIFTTLESSDFHVRGRHGGDAHEFHEFDVALCGVTAETAALSLSLVSHPCTTS